MDWLELLAQAFARQEGTISPSGQIVSSTAGARRNNPGNIADLDALKAGKFALETYNSWADGWNALRAWLNRRAREGYTLREAVYRFAPEGHGANDPATYTANVAKWTGIDPDAKLADVLRSPSQAEPLLISPPPGQATAQPFGPNNQGQNPIRTVSDLATIAPEIPRDAVLIAFAIAGAMALWTLLDD